MKPAPLNARPKLDHSARPPRAHTPRAAFTLIELLVVITVIVILLALITPALDQAITRAELTICAARHKGMGQVFANYAVEFRRKFPSGKRNQDGYEHLPFVPHDLVNYVIKNAGMNKAPLTEGDVKWGIVPELLNDPSFAESFGYWHKTYGYVIGYIYLGGHPAIQAANNGTNGYPRWESPMGLNDMGSGDLTVCWNSWTLGITPPVAGVMVGQFSVSAHAEGGAALGSEPPVGGHFYHPGSGQDVRKLGAIGGNVGFADGSAGWRDIGDMHERIAASLNGNQNASYPALW